MWVWVSIWGVCLYVWMSVYVYGCECVSVCVSIMGFHVDFSNRHSVIYPPTLSFAIVFIPLSKHHLSLFYHLHIHAKGFKWNYPIQKIMIIPEVISYQLKSPVLGVGYVTMSWECHIQSLKNQATDTVLAHQNLIVSHPLLTTLYTFITGHENSTWYWPESFLHGGRFAQS